MISPIDTILVKRTYSVSIAKRVDVQESKRLLAVPQLHGWDLSCIVVSHWTLQVRCTALPLMILQKIQFAAILRGAMYVGGLGSGCYSDLDGITVRNGLHRALELDVHRGQGSACHAQ